jgi:sugar phosphate isomerase/epimerase
MHRVSGKGYKYKNRGTDFLEKFDGEVEYMKFPVALQLYTVRDETEKDFIGTLERIAEIGYDGVEFAGFGEIKASQMKEALDRLGLKPAGSHTGMKLLTGKLDEVIEYNLEIGSPYIICPWNEYGGLEDYKEAARLFTRIGEKCTKRGLRFCYHNHAHEFRTYDGEYGLDIIYRETPPEFLAAEIDTYWVYYAGVNPPDYIRKYSGRCPIVHLKDMEAGEGRDFAEIGNGVIDIAGIIDAAKDAGAEWLVVEQDVCKRPSLESAGISFGNLKVINI